MPKRWAKHLPSSRVALPPNHSPHSPYILPRCASLLSISYLSCSQRRVAERIEYPLFQRRLPALLFFFQSFFFLVSIPYIIFLALYLSIA
jgi:hypothetical protein